MKYFYSFFICLISLSTIYSQSSEVFFANHPTLTPDGQSIIFSWQGDLWQVKSSGGLATAITTMEGDETNPKISPDGNWLAFSSNQYGNSDLYIMPLKGGDIRQLTFHQANDQLESWSWDSATLYFTSNRFNRMSTYKISIEGKTPSRLYEHYFNNIHNAVEHPLTKEMYFNETWESARFSHRKRYKGAYNPDVKSYNSNNKKYTQHTTYDGKDFWVTIDKKGKVYFVSDQANGEYNLYHFENGIKTQITDFKSSVKHPFISADGNSIVFEKDYQIFLYDVKTKTSKKVNIQISKNNTLAKTQDFKVQGKISFFDVSDDEKKLAFVSRGEIFVSDIKGEYVRQIATKKDGRVSEVYFLKDNKTLIFSQTVAGYQNWFTITADGKGTENQITTDSENNRLINFNSDKSQAVYLRGRNKIMLLHLKTFESKILVEDEIWGEYNDLPTFSPDDKYVVYTAYRNFEKDIFLHELNNNKNTNITNTAISENNPFFSPDGKYIYFSSDKVKPFFPYEYQNGQHIYRLALNKYDTPFKSDKFDELFVEKDTSKTKKEKEDKKIVKVDIDFKNLNERIEQVSPPFGGQLSPYVIQKKGKTTVLYISNHGEGKNSIWKTTYEDFEKEKTEQFKGVESDWLAIEEAGGNYYILLKGDIHTLDYSGGSSKQIKIAHTFRRNLQDEFQQMFFETWANMEVNFYEKTFHGLDWKTTRDHYATFLPHIQSRANIRTLLNDMLGELNASHFGFYTNGDEEKTFHKTKTMATGILFNSSNPYEVQRIVKNSPADFIETKIQKGDQLIKVNGISIDKSNNREFYFTQPSKDDEVQLTFNRSGKNYDVKIHPTSYQNIRTNLYDEWMNNNQKRVDEKSNKRIAYIHMKNMGGGELQRFKDEMINETEYRDALILDLRYNTGGNVHDDVLRFLQRKNYLQWSYREGKLANQSNFASRHKPIVLLINEQTLSDGEVTAAGFKALNLGTVIGTETYRWIIFTSGQSLVDGSFYRLPSWGCYTLDGKDLEITGVAPDIKINNTFFDRINGDDPQLDKAIEEVLKELKD